MSETLLIADAVFAITVDRQRRIIRDASVLVRNGRIEAVGPAADLAHHQVDRIIDASGMIVTPGFVNTHEHLYGQVMRGMNSDLIDAGYIGNSCAVRAQFTDEEAYVSTLAAVTEFLCNGTTCFVNPGDTSQLGAQFRAYKDAGCRAVVGRNYTDRPNGVSIEVVETDVALRLLDEVIDEYDGRCDGRVTAWVMLTYGTGFSSDDLVVGAKRLADERGKGLTFHQSPRQAQVDECLSDHGVRPLQHLENLGVVGPNVLLGHALRLDEAEIDVMARTETRAAMCPVAALRLGFGMAHHGKLPELLAAGVCVGLGTDTTDFGMADLLKSATLAATLYKDAREDSAMVSGEKALEMLTIDGARAAGLDDQIGSIEVGKKADLVLFDTRRPEWRPLLNPVHDLVYHADGRSVHTVLVDGSVRVEDGVPTYVDQVALGEELQTAATALLDRTGIAVRPRWPI